MSTRKETAVSFLKLAATADARSAFERYAAPDFRHHNPFFPGDADSLAAGMEANARQFPQKALKVERALEDGDVVAVHSRVRHAPDQGEFALVHIFRFEGERIAELWDIAMAVPAESPNQYGTF